jgi:hypothetical protein
MDEFTRRPRLSRQPAATNTDNPSEHDGLIRPGSDNGAPNFLSQPTGDVEPEPTPPAPAEPPKKAKKSFKAWFRGLSKRKKVFFVTGIILVVLGLLAAAYFLLFMGKNDEPTPKPQVQVAAPEPTTVMNTLTGRQVDPAVNKIPVTAAMIENSREARPQSGLQEAGVVFEAIAEGGITRYIALFQDTAPESIGPVRSVRPYYIDWAFAFNPSIAHVGGSPEALQLLKTLKAQDLDQGANGGSYDRVTSRYAPHNVYTSFARLQALQQKKGFTSSDFTGFAFKEKAAPAATPTASSVTVNISSAFYNSSYTYDKASNTYLRALAGTAHNDERTGKQITPSNVVVMTVPYRIQSDGIHSQYETIGSGEVQIFSDGIVVKGTWHKTSRDSQITFVGADGQPIKLTPGQTWVTAVSASNKVTYQ